MADVMMHATLPSMMLIMGRRALSGEPWSSYLVFSFVVCFLGCTLDPHLLGDGVIQAVARSCFWLIFFHACLVCDLLLLLILL